MSSQGFSFSQDSLRAMAQDILDHAKSRGASACEADVSEGYGQSVTVRMGAVETIEYNRDKGVGVTVYLGQRRGYASTSDFSRAALHATVDAALSIARFTAPDEAAGLPEAELLARGGMALDLYHPWPLPVDEAIDIARRCEAAAFAVSPLVRNTEGAGVSAQQSHFVSANSLGFMGGYASSRHYLSCSAIVGKGDAIGSYNDAIKVAALVDINHVARVDVLGNKDTVKNSDIRLDRGPLAIIKPSQPGIEQQFHRKWIC